MDPAKRSSTRAQQPILPSANRAPAPGQASALQRRRQSSLSSQLTFDDNDSLEGADPEDTLTSAQPQAQAQLPRTVSGFRVASKRASTSVASYLSSNDEADESDSSTSVGLSTTTTTVPAAVPPSHRLSTTPLFPSPLAQALYDDDSIDVLDIDPAAAAARAGAEDSESSEADDESEPPTATLPLQAGRRVSIPSAAGRPASRSPVRSFDRLKGLHSRNRDSSQSDRSSSSSLSSNPAGSPPAGTVTATIAERKVGYVPSSAFQQARDVWNAGAPTSSVSPPAAATSPVSLSSDTLSLRKSYHEKQHTDLARSLDFASHRSSLSAASSLHHLATGSADLLRGADLARRASLSSASTSPTHSRGQSLASVLSAETSASGSPTSPPARPLLATPSASLLLSGSGAPSPAPPAAPEAIKLQRVPTSVRIAQSIHPLIQASAASSPALAVPPAPAHLQPSPPEWAHPATPLASRANSRSASDSGAASPAASASDADSPGPPAPIDLQPLARRDSVVTARPQVSISTGAAPPSAGPSAYSPLFELPGMAYSIGAQSSPTGRSRARTVSIPSEARDEGASGVASPRTGGLPKASPAALSVSPPSAISSGLPSTLMATMEKPRAVSNSVLLDRRPSLHASPDSPSASSVGTTTTTSAGGSLASRRTAHRTSIVPAAAAQPLTDEYAQILLQSRSAKMQKWKAAAGAPGASHATPPPVFDAPQEVDLGDGRADDERELAAALELPVAGEREIEWVDWLDEYRKMKEAKLRAESQQPSPPSVQQQQQQQELTDAEMMPPPPVPSFKGKGKARESAPWSPSVGSSGSHPYASLESSPAETSIERRGSLPSEAALALEQEFSGLERTTSLATSLTDYTLAGSPVRQHSKRRKSDKSGAIAKIDAWWGAVRHSFTSQNRAGSYSAAGSIESSPASQRPLHRSPSKVSLKLGGHAIEDMPPPPVPLRRARSRPNFFSSHPGAAQQQQAYSLSPVPGGNTSGSSTSSFQKDLHRDLQGPQEGSTILAKGSLAPAAHITRPPVGARNASNKSQDSSTADSDREHGGEGSQGKRRNPHLSLNLEPRPTFIPPHLRHSHSSGTPPSGRTPARYEATPSLTPGHSPSWDRTPAPVPSSSSVAHASVPAASRPSFGRSDSVQNTTPTFSMASIQAHIRLRLQHAKENCDKELRKIMQSMTVFVDQELKRERDAFTLTAGDELSRRSTEVHELTDVGNETDSHAEDLDKEAESNDSDVLSGPSTRPVSALGHHADSSVDSSGWPAPPHIVSAPSSSTSSPLTGTIGLPLVRKGSVASSSGMSRGRARISGGTSPRRLSTQASKRAASGLRPADLSAALNRTLSQDKAAAESGATSRSTSRSRSPLPTSTPGSGVQPPGGVRTGRRSAGHVTPVTRHGSDPAASPFVMTLQAIIMIATEVLDTPVATLTSRPGVCTEFVHRTQKIGKAWDANSEWPCRGWFVQLLLAIASLSRVVEWWEAEKGFWKFGEAGESEPGSDEVMFVTKPGNEEPSSSFRSRAPSLAFPATESTASMPTVDIGEQMQQQSVSQAAKLSVTAPLEAPTEAASDLKMAVEEIRSATILVELSINEADPVFHYISPVWEEVVGLDPVNCLGVPISSLLFPGDAHLFAEATKQLLADDSHTVEVQFRLRVHSSDEDTSISEDVFETMEGKGMLVHDRETGKSTHTMWVIRPIQSQSPTVRARFGLPDHQRAISDPVTPFPFAAGQSFGTESALCRICERQIPAWFFEKHNETCAETHRLELAISDSNERLTEIEQDIQSLAAALERQSPASPLEYRGTSLLSLQPAQERPQHILVRKLQLKLLETLAEHVLMARSISTPALASESDDERSGPIESQRLLSPNSESKASVVLTWIKPVTEDPALAQLVEDVDNGARDKVGTVNRLRNTILYAERIREEWEARANSALLPPVEERSDVAMSRSHSFLSPPSEGRDSPSSLSGLGFGFGSFKTEEFGENGSPGQLVMGEEDATITAASDELAKLSLTRSPLTRSPLSRSLVSIPLAIPPTSLGAPASQSQSLFPSPSISPVVGPHPGSGDINRRQSLSTSPLLGGSQMPLSPRIPAAIPASRPKASSIKDFDIIKPISKGAFGSVYLAKKKTTGDYFAIKVLKKADMVAKNQVTNVKSERTILMLASGVDSDFVSKLYFTFQSPEYLYLVMEYLNGGDCAALIKALGCLEEDWTRSYIAEVVLGTEELHKRGIVHRDLKPDNLLIDSQGHLKLTDFGLSKIGLLGRQSRGSHFTNFQPRQSRHRSEASTPSDQNGPSTGPGSTLSHRNSYFPLHAEGSEVNSESSGSDALLQHRRATFGSTAGLDATSTSAGQKFAQGTPDYLAPETILGLGSDEGVDWWAVGVITYEFLYGVPPFHADTPDAVFENILSRRIDWHLDEFEELSPEVHDFMDRLLCSDPEQRLGANGAQEVKRHPFFKDIDWANVRKGEAAFIPVSQDPEDTNYFDPRGAVPQDFNDEVAAPVSVKPPAAAAVAPPPLSGAQHPPIHKADSDPAVLSTKQSPTAAVPQASPQRERGDTMPTFPFQDASASDDFGAFNFKNLDVLKQANQEVIKRLRSEQHMPLPVLFGGTGKRSTSVSLDNRALLLDSPPPGSSGSVSSTPSKSVGSWGSHSRRPSELMSKGRGSPQTHSIELAGHRHSRRNSLPSRLRSSSYAFPGPESLPRGPLSLFDPDTPPSSVSSPGAKHVLLPSALQDTPASQPTAAAPPAVKSVDVLVAEDNPISSKVLETILVRLGCRCVVVHNGEEVVRCTMGELVFDVIFMDMLMPILDGEAAARMIKSTNNANQGTPIVAVTSYELSSPDCPVDEQNTIFSSIIQKPVSKEAVVNVLKKLGFQALKWQGAPHSRQSSPKQDRTLHHQDPRTDSPVQV